MPLCPDVSPDDNCRRYVSVGGAGDGTSWENATSSLNGAILGSHCCALEKGAGEVWVSAGTYSVYKSSEIDDWIELRSFVSIIGGFAGFEDSVEQRDWIVNEVIIDGEHKVFYIFRRSYDDLDVGLTDVVLDGLTIRRGGIETASWGYAVRIDGGNGVRIRNCVFSDNIGGEGVAISSSVAELAVEDCLFTVNQSWWSVVSNASGSAEYHQCEFSSNFGTPIKNEGTNVSVVNSTFAHNYGAAGGIEIIEGDALIEDSVFHANHAYSNLDTYNGYSGAIHAEGGSTVVRRCSFSYNTGYLGGAIGAYYALIEEEDWPDDTDGISMYATYSAVQGEMTISDSVFYDNEGFRGGAVYVNGSTVSIANSTFFGNTHTLGEDDLVTGNTVLASHCDPYLFNGFGELDCDQINSSARVLNCIVDADADLPIVIEGEATGEVLYSLVTGGYTGDGNIDMDPLFVDAENEDFHLRAGSPCIDAANGDSASESDNEGSPRVDDPATPNTGSGSLTYVDMGAFEYQPDSGADVSPDGGV